MASAFPTEMELFARVAVALACGAAIGFEREFSEKPAGLRTHAMVAMGAATFTVAGFAGLSLVGKGVSSDPTRVAAQVVNGIGFLGAGMVIKNGDQLRGLTTAAEMWLVAAIGVMAGLGDLTLAGLITCAALIVVVGGRPVEGFVDRIRERRVRNRETDAEILGRQSDDDEVTLFGRVGRGDSAKR
jgi:putative Mg2+ transporter-C (MgtC) family protein